MPEAENQSAGESARAFDTAATGYPPMPVATRTVIKVGMVLWAVALVVTLLVPSLHEGERSWWPWTCAAGLALGVFGYLYVRRGRGNAEGVS